MERRSFLGTIFALAASLLGGKARGSERTVRCRLIHNPLRSRKVNGNRPRETQLAPEFRNRYCVAPPGYHTYRMLIERQSYSGDQRAVGDDTVCGYRARNIMRTKTPIDHDTLEQWKAIAMHPWRQINLYENRMWLNTPVEIVCVDGLVELVVDVEPV